MALNSDQVGSPRRGLRQSRRWHRSNPPKPGNRPG